MTMVVTEEAFGTDTGRHRNANEDSYLSSSPVFVVADGMGGAQAGEVASSTAAQRFVGGFDEDRLEEDLRDRIESANADVYGLANTDANLRGMGTTLTTAVVAPDRDEVVIGHVGDSRAYRIRDGSMEQITRDHSLVEEMRRKGQITDEQAESHPQRSIITRALGPEPRVDVDVQTVPVRPGDLFLLCSDGLTTMLDDRRIEAVVLAAPSLSDAVGTLIAEANAAGGRDNITVGIFKLGGAGEEPAPAPREAPTMIGRQAEAAGLDAATIREAARARQGSEGRGRGRTALRRGLKAAAALVLIGAVAAAGWWGARQVWFLGTDDGGRVALYRGLPYELPFGLELYSERYSIPIQTGSLPPSRRESVTDHGLRSRDDAVSLVESILETTPPRR